MELNTINKTGTWSETADRINSNFSKISIEVEEIKQNGGGGSGGGGDVTNADHATSAYTLDKNTPVLDWFLSALNDDDAQGIINFLKGLKISGNLVSRIVKQGDKDVTYTDEDVMSALRVMIEIENSVEKMKEIFLRKDVADSTKNFIKIDIMSDLNLENIVGFKAVDKDGNEQNVTVDEMVDMVSTRMVMALSETSTFAAAAATGNDVYENELPTVTDAANVRVLQSSGDAAKMTMQSLASKLGGLLPSGTMNIYKGKFELKTGESTDLQIYDPSILILFSPLNHNPSISIIPAQWNNTISALFEGIINLNSNIEGRICLLKKGKTVTIINNSQASKFSYLRISVDVV